MALTFDSTVGGANANSYCSVAQANEYMDRTMFPGIWDSMQDSDKERALAAATGIIEREYFLGLPASTTQRLAWPRSDVFVMNENRYYDLTEIPQCLIEATAELAKSLQAAADAGKPDPFDNAGDAVIEKVSVGPIEVDLSAKSRVATGLWKYPQVVSLLTPLLQSPGGVRLVPS